MLNASSDTRKSKPESVEDLLEEGAAEEESGDRWLGSDVAKALRFYQRAYSYYKQATTSGPSDPLVNDAYYNALRLLFHVYSVYMGSDGVDFTRIGNVDEVLTGNESSVVQPIGAIVAAHESALLHLPATGATDCLYNAALVYTEALESMDTPPVEYAIKAQSLLREVLSTQSQEFLDFLRTMLEPDQGSSNIDTNVAPESLQYTSSKTVQPPDILETLNSGLSLVRAVLENIGLEPGTLEAAVASVEQFVREVDGGASDIILSYAEQNNQHSEIVASVELQQVEEYAIGKAACAALSSDSLDNVYNIWDSENLPVSAQRYMLAADCIDTLLERQNVSSDPGGVDGNLYWAALTKMNLYFKTAQELLTEELRVAKTNTQAEGVGTIIGQLARVYIARADVDLQRCQLGTEAAQKNSTVLLNNCKAFLKSAMNIAKTSGGFRERAVEKLHREKRRYEAVSRLCVIEQKLHRDELNSIMGNGVWESYMAQYLEFWYFQRFFPEGWA